MMTERFVVQMVIHGTMCARAVQDRKFVGIACLILFFPSKNRVNGEASPTDSSKVDSSGPYSLTAVPALEVKPPIARKLRKMATPYGLGHVFCHVR